MNDAMNTTTPATTNDGQQLGIIELGQICNALRARNTELFAQLGGWVVDTPDPELQRLFAEACHRHAWHAELWAQRTPAIAPVAPSPDEPSTAQPPEAVAPADRAAVYADAIDQLESTATATSDRFDALLDPGTARTIELVLADLRAVRQRLAAATAG